MSGGGSGGSIRSMIYMGVTGKAVGESDQRSL